MGQERLPGPERGTHLFPSNSEHTVTGKRDICFTQLKRALSDRYENREIIKEKKEVRKNIRASKREGVLQNDDF